MKCTWLHFRDEESAERPNQILPIFCQILCTCTKPPILPCLLKYVLCLSARCFVELVCAEVQDTFVYSLPPCPRDKWQDSLPKKVKQLMHLERGRGSPDSETAYYVLACANLWNVSWVKFSWGLMRIASSFKLSDDLNFNVCQGFWWVFFTF